MISSRTSFGTVSCWLAGLNCRSKSASSSACNQIRQSAAVAAAGSCPPCREAFMTSRHGCWRLGSITTDCERHWTAGRRDCAWSDEVQHLQNSGEGPAPGKAGGAAQYRHPGCPWSQGGLSASGSRIGASPAGRQCKGEQPAGNQQHKQCRQPQQGATPDEQQLQHCPEALLPTKCKRDFT